MGSVLRDNLINLPRKHCRFPRPPLGVQTAGKASSPHQLPTDAAIRACARLHMSLRSLAAGLMEETKAGTCMSPLGLTSTRECGTRFRSESTLVHGVGTSVWGFPCPG